MGVGGNEYNFHKVKKCHIKRKKEVQIAKEMRLHILFPVFD